MSRRVVWLQLLLGWLPAGALFATLIFAALRTTITEASFIALRMIVVGAMLGVVVHRVTARLPWPRPMRASFLGIHLIAAGLYSVTWVLLNSVIESMLVGKAVIVVGYGIAPFLILGVWLYVMIAGVTYSAQA